MAGAQQLQHVFASKVAERQPRNHETRPGRSPRIDLGKEFARGHRVNLHIPVHPRPRQVPARILGEDWVNLATMQSGPRTFRREPQSQRGSSGPKFDDVPLVIRRDWGDHRLNQKFLRRKE